MSEGIRVICRYATITEASFQTHPLFPWDEGYAEARWEEIEVWYPDPERPQMMILHNQFREVSRARQMSLLLD